MLALVDKDMLPCGYTIIVPELDASLNTHQRFVRSNRAALARCMRSLMPSYRRKNLTLALIVRQGIALDYYGGAAIAWTFMLHHGVPLRVVQRVLSDATARRHSDMPATRTGLLPQHDLEVSN